MSLNHREWIAWVLIVLAAVSWSAGQMLLGYPFGGENPETTAPVVETSVSMQGSDRPTYSAQEQHLLDEAEAESDPFDPAIWGFVLSFVGAVMGIAAVFVLRRTAPLLGPDGALGLLALMIGIAALPMLVRAEDDEDAFEGEVLEGEEDAEGDE